MRASNAAPRGRPGRWLTCCLLIVFLCLASVTYGVAGQIYALGYDPSGDIGRAVPVRVDLFSVSPDEGSVLWPGSRSANDLYGTMVAAADWLCRNGCPKLADSDIHFQLGEHSLARQDGASAGLALLCALRAEYNGVPVTRDIGVTGALDDEGRVLPVARIDAKLAAAREAGLSEAIIPRDNQGEAEALYGELGPLRLVPVSTAQEAFDFLGMSSVVPPPPPPTGGSAGGGGGRRGDWSALVVVGAANVVLALALFYAIARRRRAVGARATTTTTLLYPRRPRGRRNR